MGLPVVGCDPSNRRIGEGTILPSVASAVPCTRGAPRLGGPDAGKPSTGRLAGIGVAGHPGELRPRAGAGQLERVGRAIDGHSSAGATAPTTESADMVVDQPESEKS